MHWMILPYRRYFDFSGRSRRLEYWWFFVFFVVAFVVLVIAAVAAGVSTANAISANPDRLLREAGVGLWTLIGIVGLFFVGSLIPMIAVQVRRLHDLGVSGWWYLAYLIGSNALQAVPDLGSNLSSLASLCWIAWMFFPGTTGPNKYGDDPKNPVGLGSVFA